MPDATENFIDKLLSLEYLDYFGNDGPLCHQGKKEQIRQKASLKETVPMIFKKTREARKKTFTLIETFGILSYAVPKLQKNIKSIYDWKSDMYGFYYYGANNENPEEIMKIITRIIVRLKEGKL